VKGGEEGGVVINLANSLYSERVRRSSFFFRGGGIIKGGGERGGV